MKKLLSALSILTFLFLQGCTMTLTDPKTLAINVDPTKSQTITSTATVECHDYFFVWKCKLTSTLSEVK